MSDRGGATEGGDESVSWTQTVTTQQYDRLRAEFPGANSDSDMGRMAFGTLLKLLDREGEAIQIRVTDLDRETRRALVELAEILAD